VRSYLTDVISDIAVNYDIDGVILDRIRYPQTSFTRANRDFGYHPDAIAAFNAETHRTGVPSPADPDWIASATDADLAYNEVTMQPEPGSGPDGKPVRGRLWFARGRWEEAWTLARRACWTTILGPDLVAATGGIEAARSTGAARVEMRAVV
jgi:hypothetical protein